MNKVLVIGAGPSMYKKIDFARSFNGDIVVCDVIAEYLLEDGIKANYITTYEIQEGIELAFFDPSLAKYGCTVVYNWKALPKLKNHLKKHGFKSTSFQSYRWERVNNVGLLGVRFAREVLKADEIYLIGFDHVGTQYTSRTYQDWLTCFEYFLTDEKDNCKIINCSGSGNLYMDGVIDGRNIVAVR